MTNEEKVNRYCKSRFNSSGLITRDTIKRHFLAIANWKDKQFEDVKDEIKVDAKKELAWEIHVKIANGAKLAELDHYVCDICDF